MRPLTCREIEITVAKEIWAAGTCPLKYAQRLAAALDCSVSDLLDNVEEKHVK